MRGLRGERERVLSIERVARMRHPRAYRRISCGNRGIMSINCYATPRHVDCHWPNGHHISSFLLNWPLTKQTLAELPWIRPVAVVSSLKIPKPTLEHLWPPGGGGGELNHSKLWFQTQLPCVMVLLCVVTVGEFMRGAGTPPPHQQAMRQPLDRAPDQNTSLWFQG